MQIFSLTTFEAISEMLYSFYILFNQVSLFKDLSVCFDSIWICIYQLHISCFQRARLVAIS